MVSCWEGGGKIDLIEADGMTQKKTPASYKHHCTYVRTYEYGERVKKVPAPIYIRIGSEDIHVSGY